MPDIIPTRQSYRGGQPANSPIPALLAQRADNVIFGPAVARPALVARQIHLCRAFLGRVGVQALALLEALGLTELVGAGLAIRHAPEGFSGEEGSTGFSRRISPFR